MFDILQIPPDRTRGPIRRNLLGPRYAQARLVGGPTAVPPPLRAARISISGKNTGTTAACQEILFPFINEEGGESSIGRRKYFSASLPFRGRILSYRLAGSTFQQSKQDGPMACSYAWA
ncbi:hypothetical protein [Labrys neptuniae]